MNAAVAKLRELETRGDSRAYLQLAGLVDRLKIQTLALRNRIAPILSDRLPRWGRG